MKWRRDDGFCLFFMAIARLTGWSWKKKCCPVMASMAVGLSRCSLHLIDMLREISCLVMKKMSWSLSMTSDLWWEANAVLEMQMDDKTNE